MIKAALHLCVPNIPIALPDKRLARNLHVPDNMLLARSCCSALLHGQCILFQIGRFVAFLRALPLGNPSKQPCQPLENPVHSSSFTRINPIQFNKQFSRTGSYHPDRHPRISSVFKIGLQISSHWPLLHGLFWPWLLILDRAKCFLNNRQNILTTKVE